MLAYYRKRYQTQSSTWTEKYVEQDESRRNIKKLITKQYKFILKSIYENKK